MRINEGSGRRARRASLGQTPLEPSVFPSSGPGLARRLAEKVSVPALLPISFRPRDKGKLCPGRIVFHPADPVSLWTISARPAKKGSVYLYGIEGPEEGKWIEVPAVELFSYRVVTEDEGIALRNLVPAMKPVDYDPSMLDVLYSVMRVSDAALIIGWQSPPPVTLEIQDTEKTAGDFAVACITSIMMAYEGLDSAGRAYDTLSIGVNAYNLIYEVGSKLVRSLHRIHAMILGYKEEGNAAIHKAAHAFFFEVMPNYILWSLYLERAILLTQVSDLSEMLNYRDGALIMESESLAMFEEAKARKNEIFATKKVTETDFKMVEDFWQASVKIGDSMDPVLDAGLSSYLGRAEMTRGQLDSCHAVLFLNLRQNLEDIEKIREAEHREMPLAGAGTLEDVVLDVLANGKTRAKKIPTAQMTLYQALLASVSKSVSALWTEYKTPYIKELRQKSVEHIQNINNLQMTNFNMSMKVVQHLKAAGLLAPEHMTDRNKIVIAVRKRIEQIEKEIKPYRYEDVIKEGGLPPDISKENCRALEEYAKIAMMDRLSQPVNLFERGVELQKKLREERQKLLESADDASHARSLANLLSAIATEIPQVSRLPIAERYVEGAPFSQEQDANTAPFVSFNGSMRSLMWENRLDPAIVFYVAAKAAIGAAKPFAVTSISSMEQRITNVYKLFVKNITDNLEARATALYRKNIPKRDVQWLEEICGYFYEGMPVGYTRPDGVVVEFKDLGKLPDAEEIRELEEGGIIVGRVRWWINFERLLTGEVAIRDKPMPLELKKLMVEARKNAPNALTIFDEFARDAYYKAALTSPQAVNLLELDKLIRERIKEVKAGLDLDVAWDDEFNKTVALVDRAIRESIEASEKPVLQGSTMKVSDIPVSAPKKEEEETPKGRRGRPRIVSKYGDVEKMLAERWKAISSLTTGEIKKDPDKAAKDYSDFVEAYIQAKIAQQEVGVDELFWKIKNLLGGKPYIRPNRGENQVRLRTRLAAFAEAAKKTKLAWILSVSVLALLGTILVVRSFSKTPSSWSPRDPKSADPIPPLPVTLSDVATPLVTAAVIGIPLFLFLRMLKRKRQLSD